MKKLTPAAIGALTLAATLALALPAQANGKITQTQFARDCDTTASSPGDGVKGTVTIAPGEELEVENKSKA